MNWNRLVLFVGLAGLIYLGWYSWYFRFQNIAFGVYVDRWTGRVIDYRLMCDGRTLLPEAEVPPRAGIFPATTEKNRNSLLNQADSEVAVEKLKHGCSEEDFRQLGEFCDLPDAKPSNVR